MVVALRSGTVSRRAEEWERQPWVLTGRLVVNRAATPRRNLVV
jgi:hypothetical protein